MATIPSPPPVRRKIFLRGIVQGVGFRPFVYNLARKLNLSGYVLNSSSGLTIEVEGTEADIEEFLDAVRSHPPPLACITDVSLTPLPAQEDGEFIIRPSLAEAEEFVLISADVATCEECCRDFTDPANRRFGYPFTNCTNCGPRYTIVQDIPYDRPKTTMAAFPMCESCRAEYEDPTDRRFHAQPNACATCGPSIVLAANDAPLPQAADYAAAKIHSRLVLRRARSMLHHGGIVAVKGLGGFLLACDAENDSAVRLLRQRKHRSDKPFAVMARDLAAVEAFCIASESDRAALENPRRPIVILPRRPGAKISGEIAPGNNSIGVMLPCSPLHFLLFGESSSHPPEFPALVMTSGNISEEPIVTSNAEAHQRLAPIADQFVFHNRDIYMRADDSVVRTFQGQERVLRRSRGYVPQPVDLGMSLHELLACGAELKNTFCLTKNRFAILSQHIGDLENYETLRFFEETLANLKKLFRVEPKAVAYDLHPQYLSTRLALALPLQRKIGIQHHHAHIASCMAENHLRGKVIGVAFDGTGYGADGKIWGGEFLIADYARFERRAHLRYVALPGGDAAIRQPWRMALSYLRDTYGNGSLPECLPLLREIPKKEFALVDAMIARRIPTTATSSCGRLFDAVAAMLGLGIRVSFEGQSAIALENAALAGIEDHYGFSVEDQEPMRIDMRPTIEGIVRDIAMEISPAQISARFHNTVAAVITDICRRLRQRERLHRVCLSGGVFQNMYLLDRGVRELRRAGFEVFLHAQVPPNDGGISLGQAVIANEQLRLEG